MMTRWLVGCGCVAFSLTLASPVWALPSTVRIAIDTDGVPTGGCALTTVDGSFAGAEQLLTVAIETANATATVLEVERQECAAGVFGPPVVVDAGSWPVGIALGEGGSHVVEAHVPLLDLGPLRSLRFGIVHVAGADSDALLETLPLSGEPIVLVVRATVDVPTISEWGILLLVLLLVTMALRKLRRPEIRVVVLLIAFVGVCGWAWAACLMDGMIDDWTASDPLALDTPDDAPESVDLRAFFAKVDGAELCLRVDTDLAFDQPPLAVDDAFEVDEASIDNSLDVLANDTDPEAMPLTIVSVGSPDQGGGATTDGQFVLYTPAAAYVGVETFSYDVGDGAGGTDTATVTVTVMPLCGNGVQEVYPQTRAACSGLLYGATSPSPTEPSDLYTLDASTGVGTLIGAISVPGVGSLVRVSAMDFDPDGRLHGIGTLSNQLVLVQIDCVTAEATLIGPLGLSAGQGSSITDMAFDPIGRLWAHYRSSSADDELGLVNRVTGGYATVGATGLDDIGNGLASVGFPTFGVLHHAGSTTLSTLDPLTGAAAPLVSLVFPPEADDAPRINGMDVDFETGSIYVSLNDRPLGPGSLPQNFVAGLNPVNGEVVGVTDPLLDAPDSLDAIAVNRVYEACDTGTPLPPGASCGGSCRPVEETCGDGLDNDFDGLTDCADPDCDLRPCDDLEACTTSDTCLGGQCLGEADPSCDLAWLEDGIGAHLLRAEGMDCRVALPFLEAGDR